MNEANNSQVCERSEDLVAFLYGELGEREAHSFEQHRRNCVACDEEVKSFGPIRQSIGAWRDQSLGLGTISSFSANPLQAFPPAKNRSALAAIREFFALSPLWLKGATAVTTVLLCVLSALAVARLLGNSPSSQISQGSPPESTSAAMERKIQDEVTKRVAEALANTPQSSSSELTVRQPERRSVPAQAQSRKDFQAQAGQKLSKPLTRAERERLAADLRLVLDDEYDSLQLLGDRINR